MIGIEPQIIRAVRVQAVEIEAVDPELVTDQFMQQPFDPRAARRGIVIKLDVGNAHELPPAKAATGVGLKVEER